jgi:hypothetical protein
MFASQTIGGLTVSRRARELRGLPLAALTRDGASGSRPRSASKRNTSSPRTPRGGAKSPHWPWLRPDLGVAGGNTTFFHQRRLIVAHKRRAILGMLELTALTTCPRRTKEVERLQATLRQATSACIQNLSYTRPYPLRAARPDASASP